jgi:hypothetical protein
MIMKEAPDGASFIFTEAFRELPKAHGVDPVKATIFLALGNEVY